MKYMLSDVFNEAQIPSLTFVEPREFKDIVGSLRTSGKHITLCGPSGCGKTTLATKALERAGFGEDKVYWMSGRDHTKAMTLAQMLSSEFACPAALDDINQWMIVAGIVIMDDFHHLDRAVRQEVALQLKRWHELKIRVFIVGIAESTRELLGADPELGIRNDPYDMMTQSDAFISEVIRLGEEALRISFHKDTREQFVRASKGIPSAVHVICRVACIRADVNETQDAPREVRTSLPEIKDGVMRIYKAKYQNKVIGLAKGKQQARSVHNMYFQIIRTICVLDRTEISTQELRDRIVAIEPDPTERNKKNTSFYNCLNNLPAVISERGLGDAIYYDNVSGTISIEDPSFRLYLSLLDLGELERSVRVRTSTYPWDVAISFAGEQRPIAEEIRAKLNTAGYTVFYDFDQQHLLWGANLRRKLADVYANEAEYMLILLSKEYPEKEWPAFEYEIAKDARRKRPKTYILPLLVDDANIVGLSHDYGHLDLRRMSTDEVVRVLIDKIEAEDAPNN